MDLAPLENGWVVIPCCFIVLEISDQKKKLISASLIREVPCITVISLLEPTPQACDIIICRCLLFLPVKGIEVISVDPESCVSLHEDRWNLFLDESKFFTKHFIK